MDTQAIDVRRDAGSQRSVERRLRNPFLVLRVASSSLTDMEQLKADAVYEASQQLRDLTAQTAHRIADVCSDLAICVRQSEWTDRERNDLIQIKRDLHNRRPGRIANLLASLSEPAALRIRDDVSHSIALIDELASKERAFHAQYDQALSNNRLDVRNRSLANPNLLKGISYSAPELLRDLQAAAAAPEKYSGKRGRDLDRALFNFFARGSVKVSPLTWFTPTLVGRWEENTSLTLLDLADRTILSRVELSRRLITKVASSLIKNPNTWSSDTIVRLNPTISFAGDLCRFSDIWADGGSSPRTWGVTPPVLQTAVNAHLESLHRLLEGRPEGLAANVLHETLTREAFAGDERRGWSFIAHAIKIGLLCPYFDSTEQESPEPGLRKLLTRSNAGCLPVMDGLDEALQCFRDGNGDVRLEARQAIFKGCADLLAATHSPPDSHASPRFYEDCIVSGEVLKVAPPAAAGAPAAFQVLSTVFPLLDFNHVIQSVIGALFRKTYAGPVPAASILNIAEEAQALAHRLTPMPLSEQADALEDLSPNAAALLRGKFALLTGIFNEIAGGRDVWLSDGFLHKYQQLIPDEIRHRPTSYTIIGQTFHDEHGPGFALNRVYSGHCMLMSRFMRELPADDVEEVRRYLGSYVGPEARLAEIPGVFGFNANLHPQFAASEISLPGRRANFAETAKVSLDGLSVSYDEKLDRLRFSDRDGREVLLHYFGFLNLMVLPPIYQLLGRSYNQGLILDIWQELLFAGFLPRDIDQNLGRLRYGAVALSRRSTYISPASLPDPAGREADFYLEMPKRLSTFADAGADFYARLVADREDFMPGAKQAPGAAIDTTDFKPSYFSLKVPASVSAFQRQLVRRLRGALIQEALPDLSVGGVLWQGRRHACEIQFEIGHMHGGE